MFGMFRRKDKEKTTGTDGQGQAEVWGQPGTRKLSKDEAARETAAQKQVEQRNRERRDMYRPAGQERIFNDPDGRHFSLRTEDNTGPQASPHHPPLVVLVFWGVREIGHVQAEVGPDGALRQREVYIEEAFKGRGIAAQMLVELEQVARAKGLVRLVCTPQPGNEWAAAFLSEAGFQSQGVELVKVL